VGDSGVGKTCLIERMFSNRFDSHLPATIGAYVLMACTEAALQTLHHYLGTVGKSMQVALLLAVCYALLASYVVAAGGMGLAACGGLHDFFSCRGLYDFCSCRGLPGVSWQGSSACSQ
jgi:hypothetical protein